jgi:hypothetical protein
MGTSRRRSAPPHRAPLVLCCLAVLWALPLAASDIPLDRNGLPLWQTREWNDFPVRLELADPAALDALLAEVPLAAFSREDVRPVFDSPKSYRLIVETRVTEAEHDALVKAGHAPERLPDLERRAREEMERIWADQAAKGGEPLATGEKGVYHTHAQIGTILAQTQTDHATLAADFVWGFSVQGRELWGIVISDNVGTEEAEPEVRLSSTIHGDEPVGTEMLLFLVDYLTDNYGQPGYEDVTYLVDSYEIHIMPMHNPDGYVAHTRTNANGVDMNRNFPVPNGNIGGDGTYVEEIETVAYKDYCFLHDFVIGQDAHTGALVVNYPWDYTYALTPDNDAFIELSLEYSTYNLPMYNSPSFPQGITNGAQWYVTEGSIQDWSYQETGCCHVITELNNIKWPDASALDGLWEDNRESLMHWIKAARYGVNGVVTGSDTGLPLAATVTVVGNAKTVQTDPSHGDYYKLLDTGTYDLTFAADGYITETHYGVSTVWGTPTVLDVDLDPVAHGDIAGVVEDTAGSGLTADVEVRTYPADDHVTTVQSDGGSGGAYTVPYLVYGQYRLIFTADGYTSVQHVVTLDAALATQDAVLGSAEEVVLFGDDFEDGAGQWTGGWGLADPATGHSPDNSLTDSPGDGVKYSSYEDNACVMGSSVDLSGAFEGALSFWAKWDIENSWDCCQLQVSVDGGAWQALATQYTDAGSGQGAQTPSGTPVFDGSQAGWVENAVDLSPWFDETDVRFRFWLGSDSSIQKDGFYFDDFEVRVTREAVSGAGATPAAPLPLQAFPNPFNPATTLRFRTAQDGPVALDLYDVQGRRVRRLLHAVRSAGDHGEVWDGRGDRGQILPSGVYFARLETGVRRETLKVMLVK